MTCRDVTLPHTSLPPVLNMVQQNTYFLLVRNKPFFTFSLSITPLGWILRHDPTEMTVCLQATE